jgi:succinate dehydrogenase/fumarate reductase flavoprotein subunit
MCTGIAAGIDAADYIAKVTSLPDPSPTAIEERKRFHCRPLENENGLSYRQFEDRLRQVMSAYAAIGRTKSGLEIGLAELEKLSYCTLRAETGHDLLRCCEAGQLLDVALMIVRGALMREESRFGLSHYRGDFPESRAEFHKGITQTLINNEIKYGEIAPYEL